MKVDKMLHQVVRFTKKNSTTILSIASGIGVIGSMILVAKETPLALSRIIDAENEKEDDLTPLETVIIAAPAYIPAIVIGASTLVCIASCSILNTKRQNQLVALCNLANNSFRQYREKLIELKGEELDREITAEVTRSRSDYLISDSDSPDAHVLWYDPYSERYFKRFEREIIDAEYQLNRDYALNGYVSLNDWYEMLSIPYTNDGYCMGWTIEDGVYWIDFEHHKQEMPDGNTCYSIASLIPPTS